jgi:hypothetical protein
MKLMEYLVVILVFILGIVVGSMSKNPFFSKTMCPDVITADVDYSSSLSVPWPIIFYAESVYFLNETSTEYVPIFDGVGAYIVMSGDNKFLYVVKSESDKNNGIFSVDSKCWID